MTSSLATRQGLLTRANNRLSAILDENEQLFARRLDSNLKHGDVKDFNRRIRVTKATLSMEVGKVEDALCKYSSKVDELPIDTPSKEEFLKRAQGSVDTTQEILECAHLALSKLAQLQEELEDQAQAHTPSSEEKYINTQALVDQLVDKLQASRARSYCSADQLASCDQLSPLALQLELKRRAHQQHFPAETITEQVLHGNPTTCPTAEKQKRSEGTWSTKILLAEAKEFVTSELKINVQVEQRQPSYGERQEKAITKFRMEEDRQRVPQHRHAFTAASQDTRRKVVLNTSVTSTGQGNQEDFSQIFTSTQPTAAKMNTDASEQGLVETEEMDTVLHVSNRADVLILAGQAQVLNTQSKRLEKVHVMLDSGADRSFISNPLADRLQ
ncbi:hypothetical protein OSTOST_01971 [Ostertagia ostertagi]